MDLDYLVLILLFWGNGHQLDAIEEYDIVETMFSDQSSWTDAMMFCLAKGGRPASYSDLLLKKENEIIRKVWTADYGVLHAETLNTNDSVLSDVLYHECGYTIIDTYSFENIGWSWEANLMKYVTTLTSKGEHYYDTCTSRRPFICIGTAFPVIFFTQQTISEAKESCLNENKTLGQNFSFTEQFATIFPPEDHWQRSFEVWTNETRLWHLQTFTNHLEEDQIEKVGVYDHNGSFRLVDLKSETKLRSICLYADNSYREPLYSNRDNGLLRWIQVFLPPACMIFVAILGSFVAWYLVRRQRREEISPPFARFTKRKTGHTMTGVLYDNMSYCAVPTVGIVDRDHTAELGQVAKPSVPEAYITADVTNLVELRDVIPNSAEDNVYDNKDFATHSSLQQTTNLYDRANFLNGEPLYD